MNRFVFLSMAILLVLSACGGMAAAPAQRSMDFAEPSAPMMEAPAESFAPESGADYESNAAGFGTEAAQVERLVIQNADLSVVVADPEAKMQAIQKMAESMGGFVVSSNIYQTYTSNNVKVPEGNITVRIPAGKLDQALEQIKEDAVEVQNETRSGQDVTSEYVDLQSRLKTHQQAAEQLSEILSEKTESQEVLDVFNQLVYHREQIELIKGQMNYFEEAAALSAVSVRIIAEDTLQPLEIAGWKPVGVARDALQTLINFFQGFINFLIWLIILIIPAGILILGLLWLVWRLFSFLWRKLFPHKAKKDTKETSKT
jgi:hypothetical protein